IAKQTVAQRAYRSIGVIAAITLRTLGLLRRLVGVGWKEHTGCTRSRNALHLLPALAVSHGVALGLLNRGACRTDGFGFSACALAGIARVYRRGWRGCRRGLYLRVIAGQGL